MHGLENLQSFVFLTRRDGEMSPIGPQRQAIHVAHPQQPAPAAGLETLHMYIRKCEIVTPDGQ